MFNFFPRHFLSTCELLSQADGDLFLFLPDPRCESNVDAILVLFKTLFNGSKRFIRLIEYVLFDYKQYILYSVATIL